jgi:hypothetical protein
LIIIQFLGSYNALVTFSHGLNTGITLSGSYQKPFDYKPYPSQNIETYQISSYQQQYVANPNLINRNPYPSYIAPVNRPQVIFVTTKKPTTTPRPVTTTRFMCYRGSTDPRCPPNCQINPSDPRCPRTTRKTTTTTKAPIRENFTCGERFGTPSVVSTVFGGKKAGQYDFPWLVAHFYKGAGFLCGGSLVSHKIVVTAAHCE